MKSDDKTKEQLLKEIDLLKAKIAGLEKSEIDRKRAEDALQETEQTYRNLFNTCSDGVAITSLNGELVDANQAYQDMLGYTLKELKGINFQKLTPKKWNKPEAEAIKNFMSKGYGTFEKEYIRKDGAILPVSLTTWLIKDAQGNPAGIGAFVKDITDRKKAEEALRESEEKHRLVLDNANVAIHYYDIDGTVRLFNRQSVENMGGGEPKDFVGESLFEILPDFAEENRRRFHEIAKTGEGIEREDVSELPSGQRWFWSSLQPVKNLEGKVTGIQVISTDITERKQMEEQLKKSLKEKEILIKEIFHRVKNNLAVVSGLLNIQAANIKDKKAKAAFQATRDRIFSLSAVHSQLYHSENYSYVDYKEYIKKLVSNIYYSFQMSGHVKLHLDLADITLPIDKAIPCGLLVNEIVTNALKHAFPEKRKGNLRITTHSLEDKNIEIIVKDDGIGIPESFNIEKTETLGLKLIDLMTKQIEGTLEIESKKGTEFKIRLSTEPG